MSIGQKIKAAREQKGMTLDDVAALCSTTKQTIFKYENDIVTNIPYDRVILLSKALGVTPSYLFGWEENSPDELQLTEGETALIQLFRKIPQDKQRIVIEMIRAALKSEALLP